MPFEFAGESPMGAEDDDDDAPSDPYPSFGAALDDEVAWRCPIARHTRQELGLDY